jgi:Fe2+ or Zn2+ uptake regulation protein
LTSQSGVNNFFACHVRIIVTVWSRHATCLDHVPDKRALLLSAGELQKKNGAREATQTPRGTMPKKLSKTSASAQASPVIAVRETDVKFTPSQRLVLYALASRMSSFDADVWPSIATIARNTSLSEDTARRAVHQLIELGVLVEQAAERRTKTFKIVLPDPRMVQGQPGTVQALHDATHPSQGAREDSHHARGTPRTMRAEDQSEVSIEDPSEAKDRTPLRLHEVASLVERIRNAIDSDVDLARTCAGLDVDSIATEYATHEGEIDALATIRDAGDYLRTEKGRTIRNGRDHLLLRLEWAIASAGKRTKRKEPTKPSQVVDFSTQPLLPTRMIRVRF